MDAITAGLFRQDQPKNALSPRLFLRCPIRPLFASIHSDVNTYSGAALATREILELLVGRSVDCQVLSARVLDHEGEPSLDGLLATLELSVLLFLEKLGRRPVDRCHRPSRKCCLDDAYANRVLPRRTLT